MKVEPNGAVLRIALDRPELRNAFNPQLIEALAQEFERLEPHVRVVLLSGEGPVFCAGGDLNWLRAAATQTRDENVDEALRLGRLYDAIARCSAAVVVRAHGAAFGGGCGLVAAADVAVAESGTKFSFSEVRLGMIPAVISRIVLPKIGAGHARALFATGESFDAAHALRIGLVQEVRSGLDDVDRAVGEKIKAVLASGPRAVAEAKRLVLDAPLSLEEAALRLASAREGSEAQEGLAAFLEKRRASFVEDYPV